MRDYVSASPLLVVVCSARDLFVLISRVGELQVPKVDMFDPLGVDIEGFEDTRL